MPRRILVLGGTGEARELAGLLIAAGFDTITSLAGVTGEPIPPPGKIRRGGFGGEEGLVEFLRTENIAAVADASHPYAATISRAAHAAALQTGIAYCRLERPAWEPEAGDRWSEAASASEAAKLLPAGARVLLTIGRKNIAPFLARADLSGLVRSIETLADELPDTWLSIRIRPPFTFESEVRLIAEHRIDHLVSKNAGGEDTSAKLAAAREARIPVVMIARPVKPPAPCAWPAEALLPVLRGLLSP